MTSTADQKSQNLVRLKREYDLDLVIRMNFMCWIDNT